MKVLAAVVFSLLLTTGSIAQREQATKTIPLFRIVQNGKWGYIDPTGKIVIAPRFEQATSFTEGMARIKVGKLFGFIDVTGKLVVPARYPAASDYSEGLARVMVGSKWGFIDKSGRMVIPAIFSDASDFGDGAFSAALQPMTQGKRHYRLADRTGKFFSPPNLNVVSTFSEGLAQIRGGERDYKSGYVNKQWEVVIEPQYGNASSFREGLAVVDTEIGKSFVIDKSGKIVISNYGVTLQGFSEGLIPFFQLDDKSGESLHGFLDKNGVVVIKPRFQDAENFSEGLAVVEFRGKYGFIDLSGNFVIKPQFDSAGSFYYGLAGVWIDGKLGYIDKTGNYIWKPTE